MKGCLLINCKYQKSGPCIYLLIFYTPLNKMHIILEINRIMNNKLKMNRFFKDYPERKHLENYLLDIFDDSSIYSKSSGDIYKIAELLTRNNFAVDRMRILKKNPNFKFNFFQDINTLNNAYWLGFIYADGTISKELNYLEIKLSIKDMGTLLKLADDIGIESDKIKISKNNTGRNIIKLRIYSIKVVRDLLKHGVVPNKSKLIRYPDLGNRKLDLAFLLGFFDGDGTQKTSILTSSNLDFLLQIQKKMNLKSKPYPKKPRGYYLTLGAEVFNEMLENYPFSMKRKAIKFKTNEERINRIKSKVWNHHHERKLKISKWELKKMVWIMPMTKISKIYNVSDKTIKKWCEKWNIDTPNRGDWRKIQVMGIQPKSKEDWNKINKL